MVTESSTLESEIVGVAKRVKQDRKLNKEFKNLVGEYNILIGDAIKFLGDPEEFIKGLSTKELIIYSLQLYKATKDESINPENYYNNRQIKEATTTFEGHVSEQEHFPIVLDNAIQIGDSYFVPIKVSTFRKLNNAKEIQYNPNTQRNVKYKASDDGVLIPIPRINNKSVEQIRELFKKKRLESTLMVFNARLGSADDGVEVYFDPSDKTLTIYEGTLFDCLDGYHRFLGTVTQQEENPEIDMEFMVKILNRTEKHAKDHFVQTNTINPVSKGHMEKMDQENFNNQTVQFLSDNSELRDRITSNDIVTSKQGELTTFWTLSEAIKKNFALKTRKDSIDLGKYLTEFFNELFFTYSEEFLGDILKVKKESYINAQSMFAGYIILAKRMQEENINISKLSSIIDDIDFNKSTNTWINNEKNISKDIENYFKNLNLDKYK